MREAAVITARPHTEYISLFGLFFLKSIFPLRRYIFLFKWQAPLSPTCVVVRHFGKYHNYDSGKEQPVPSAFDLASRPNLIVNWGIISAAAPFLSERRLHNQSDTPAWAKSFLRFAAHDASNGRNSTTNPTHFQICVQWVPKAISSPPKFFQNS